MRISDGSSDVCSSDLTGSTCGARAHIEYRGGRFGFGWPAESSWDRILECVCGVRQCSCARFRRHCGQFHAPGPVWVFRRRPDRHSERSEEHTSELQSLMRISYAVFCLKKKNHNTT